MKTDTFSTSAFRITRFAFQSSSLLLASILISGCAAGKITAKPQQQQPPQQQQIPQSQSQSQSQIKPLSISTGDSLGDLFWRKALEDHLKRWEGTQHVWGGNSRKGIDCSAYTQRVYKEIFDRKLPRTTRQQVEIGQSISKSDLRVGDLVFFSQNRRIDHVGIYLGDNSFMHVGSKIGVSRSRLDQGYWKRYFTSARRILDCRSC